MKTRKDEKVQKEWKTYSFGRTKRENMDVYQAEDGGEDELEFVRSGCKADAIVLFKKIDFDELEEMMERGYKVVWDCYPRFTPAEADALSRKERLFDGCVYVGKTLYTNFYETLKTIVTSGELGKLTAVKMTSLRNLKNDMLLRRAIAAELSVLFSLVGWTSVEDETRTTRRGVAVGNSVMRFSGGVTAEYEYTTEKGKEFSTWEFTFTGGKIVCNALKGVVQVCKDGEDKWVEHRYSVTPKLNLILEDLKKFTQGEEHRFIPIAKFLLLRKVLLGLR